MGWESIGFCDKGIKTQKMTLQLDEDEAKLLDLRVGVVSENTVRQRLRFLLHLYTNPRYAPEDRENVLRQLTEFADFIGDVELPQRKDTDIYCGSGYVDNDQVIGTQKECWDRGVHQGDKHGAHVF